MSYKPDFRTRGRSMPRDPNSFSIRKLGKIETDLKKQNEMLEDIKAQQNEELRSKRLRDAEQISPLPDEKLKDLFLEIKNRKKEIPKYIVHNQDSGHDLLSRT